jgi:hypothetical protein
MLKIVALIECDTCGSLFEKIACASTGGDAILDEIHQLQLECERAGWTAKKVCTEHECPDCPAF